MPFSDDLAEVIASLDHIAGLPAAWVLPGHGPAFHGSPAEAVAAVRAASS